MTKPEILQIGRLPQGDQVLLDADYTCHRYFEAADAAAFLAKVGPSVRAIVTRGDLGADRTMIEACPRLEVVAICGVGFDAVDMARARARGIGVSNTPDVLSGDCADLGVAMMLCLARGIVPADAFVRGGSWASKGDYGLQRRVWGKKAGILGMGRIGVEVARRLHGFGMEIAYSARSPKTTAENWQHIADPVALAARSDFLFVTLSATPQTRHIVGREVISALGPHGMLINISRAANVDEEALLAALENGALGSAALDVFEGEPRLNPRFARLTNVLLQPHHASGTVETRQAMGDLMRENLRAHFAGQGLVTPVP